MSAWFWIPIGFVAWILIGIAIGYVFGGVIRHGDNDRD